MICLWYLARPKPAPTAIVVLVWQFDKDVDDVVCPTIMVWKMEASFRLGRTTDLAGVDSVPTVTSLLCLQPDHYQLVLFMAEYMDLAYPPEIGRLCGRMLVAFWVIHVFFYMAMATTED